MLGRLCIRDLVILLIKSCRAAKLVRDYMLFKALDLITSVVKDNTVVLPQLSVN